LWITPIGADFLGDTARAGIAIALTLLPLAAIKTHFRMEHPR
jgi:hypothetical protein